MIPHWEGFIYMVQLDQFNAFLCFFEFYVSFFCQMRINTIKQQLIKIKVFFSFAFWSLVFIPCIIIFWYIITCCEQPFLSTSYPHWLFLYKWTSYWHAAVLTGNFPCVSSVATHKAQLLLFYIHYLFCYLSNYLFDWIKLYCRKWNFSRLQEKEKSKELKEATPNCASWSKYWNSYILDVKIK